MEGCNNYANYEDDILSMSRWSRRTRTLSIRSLMQALKQEWLRSSWFQGNFHHISFAAIITIVIPVQDVIIIGRT